MDGRKRAMLTDKDRTPCRALATSRLGAVTALAGSLAAVPLLISDATAATVNPLPHASGGPALPAVAFLSNGRIVFCLLLGGFLLLTAAGFILSRRSAGDALKAEDRRFQWRG